jgi:hypothetical protein
LTCPAFPGAGQSLFTEGDALQQDYLISTDQFGADTKSVTPPDDALIREYRLDTAMALWDAAKGEHPAPSWRDFDLMELPNELRRGTMVADYHPGRNDFYIRFWGDDLVRAFNVELSQKWLSQCDHNGLMNSFTQTGHLVAERLEPQWLMHEITSSGGLRRHFPVLRLPLMDAETGQRHVMTVENIEMSLRFFAGA